MEAVDKEILKLAVPSILANITVPIVGMVDIAVAGHLDANAATLIGGIAVGSMLFDLLYWNFGFLRVGTGGLTAQAFGRRDMKECAGIFSRAMCISLLCAAVLIAVQWLFVKLAFLVVDCTPEVRALASEYFFIRIWAAPATLSLMAFKGWFIGMQDGVSPMVVDLTVNAVNVVMSLALAVGFSLGRFEYEGMGFPGIAAGTVIAQYSGLLCASSIAALKYRKKVFAGYSLKNFKESLDGRQTRRFFALNTDLFIRSVCFIGIYIGFTTISAHYGDLLLASSSIMMKLLMIFSYFTDGFAYAGEALTGKYIGEGNRPVLQSSVVHTFGWSMAIGVVFMAVYGFAGVPMLEIMTSDPEVVAVSEKYLPWLLLMPLAGCAAFTWDGIYVGATASKAIRNAMILSAAGFFAVYFAGTGIMKLLGLQGDAFSCTAIHILLGAYFVHLIIRTVHLSVQYKKVVLATVSRK